MQGYCVKCKKKVTVKAPKKVKYQTRSGTRYAIKGKCPKCGTNVTRFIKK